MTSRRRLWLKIGIIIAVLWAIAIPTYQFLLRKSRESALETNLVTMRSVIKQYVQDKQRAPHSLQDLLDAGYFRDELPFDPITNSTSSWKSVIGNVVVAPGQAERGITDIRSGSSSMSSRGTAYSTW
jgi:general secretion pathway protein G